MRPRLADTEKRKKLTLSIDPNIYEILGKLSKILSSGNQSRLVEECIIEWLEKDMLLAYGNMAIRLDCDGIAYDWVNLSDEVVKGGFPSIKKALDWYIKEKQKGLFE